MTPDRPLRLLSALLALPESRQFRLGTVKAITIAPSNPRDTVRLWTNTAVRVLPQCPLAPSGRNDRRRTILREPEPAPRQHGIGLSAKEFLDVMARIQSRPASGYLVHVSDKRSRFDETH